MLCRELIDGEREIMASAKEWLLWLTANIVIVRLLQIFSFCLNMRRRIDFRKPVYAVPIILGVYLNCADAKGVTGTRTP